MTTPAPHDDANPTPEPVPDEGVAVTDDERPQTAETTTSSATEASSERDLADPLITTVPPAAPPAAATGVAGQHAAPRPYPPVAPASARGARPDADGLLPGPPPAPTAQVPAGPAPTGTQATAVLPVAAPAAGPGPVPAAAPLGGPGAPAAPVASRPAVPDLPRRPGAKRHLVAVLVGLLLTPVGLVLAAMGIGHMVDLPAGSGALTDVFGLVQLGAGALVLLVVALAGRWSPAVPLTGGLVWGLGGGGLALWDPQGVSEAVHGVTDGRFAQVAIDHILAPAQTGSLLVLGLVLVGSAIATGAARRAGRVFGTRTVRAEAARAEAQRVDADRRAGAPGDTRPGDVPRSTP